MPERSTSDILTDMQTDSSPTAAGKAVDHEMDLHRRAEEVRAGLADSVGKERQRKSRGRLRRFFGAAVSTIAIIYLVVWFGPWMPWEREQDLPTEELPTQQDHDDAQAEINARFDRILGAIEARQNLLSAQLQNGQRPIPEGRVDDLDLLAPCITQSLLSNSLEVDPTHVCIDGEWRAIAPTNRTEGVR